MSVDTGRRPTPERVAAAVIAAVLYAALTATWLATEGRNKFAQDFTHPYIGGLALLNWQDPYVFIWTQPRPWNTGFPYWPFAALFTAPVAWLPDAIAGAIFVGLGMGWLAYHLARDGPKRLWLLWSAPAFFTARSVQISPFLTAAALSGPWLALTLGKPNAGLALWAAFFPDASRGRRTLVRTVALLILLIAFSFAWVPDWLPKWLSALNFSDEAIAAQYRPPILTWYGAPTVLALLKWRRVDARLLLAFACMPQNGFFYEQLPLALIPGSGVEVASFVLLSQFGYVFAQLGPTDARSFTAWNDRFYFYMVLTVYLPCLIMVLRRPNEGAVWNWVEKIIAGWPRWLRGSRPPDHTAALAS